MKRYSRRRRAEVTQETKERTTKVRIYLKNKLGACVDPRRQQSVPVFHKKHKKRTASLSKAALTLQCSVPCQSRSGWARKKSDGVIQITFLRIETSGVRSVRRRLCSSEKGLRWGILSSYGQ